MPSSPRERWLTVSSSLRSGTLNIFYQSGDSIALYKCAGLPIKMFAQTPLGMAWDSGMTKTQQCGAWYRGRTFRPFFLHRCRTFKRKGFFIICPSLSLVSWSQKRKNYWDRQKSSTQTWRADSASRKVIRRRRLVV